MCTFIEPLNAPIMVHDGGDSEQIIVLRVIRTWKISNFSPSCSAFSGFIDMPLLLLMTATFAAATFIGADTFQNALINACKSAYFWLGCKKLCIFPDPALMVVIVQF